MPPLPMVPTDGSRQICSVSIATNQCRELSLGARGLAVPVCLIVRLLLWRRSLLLSAGGSVRLLARRKPFSRPASCASFLRRTSARWLLVRDGESCLPRAVSPPAICLLQLCGALLCVLTFY